MKNGTSVKRRGYIRKQFARKPVTPEQRGGFARAKALSPRERRLIAKMGGKAAAAAGVSGRPKGTTGIPWKRSGKRILK
jgi:hypothetical protein